MTGRVSRGHVVMVVAGLVGIVLSFAALREHDGSARVVVAAHEIRAGERVSSDDFRSEAVTMSGAAPRHRGPSGRPAVGRRTHRGGHPR